MATTYVNMGRSSAKPNAIIVHAYEGGYSLPMGIFLGFIKGITVKLYPADYSTKCKYKGNDLDITIYDLKPRRIL